MPTSNETEPNSHGIIEAVGTAPRLRKVYDLWSATYDYVAGPFERAAGRAALERADIGPHDKVLEVAVGTGETFREVAGRTDRSNTVCGLDFSPKMLARTRRRMTRAGLDNWALCRGDARRLPFGDDAFDVVLNGYMLDLIQLADLPVVMAEFFRVLKPRGRLVLVNFSKAELNERTWWERMYQRMPKSWAAYLLGGCRPVVMAPLAREAGFCEVERDFRPGLFLPTEIITARKP
jgi:ubiquinone/menaquinone biosynthesis C-methylase UbiE